jgi:hypothetical protein
MSSNTTDIERKITQNNVPAAMPNRFRDACADAYRTNTLNLNIKNENDVHLITTEKELVDYIIPFLKYTPNITHLAIRLDNLGLKAAQALTNTTLKTITFLWSDLATNAANNNLMGAGAQALACDSLLNFMPINIEPVAESKESKVLFLD